MVHRVSETDKRGLKDSIRFVTVTGMIDAMAVALRL